MGEGGDNRRDQGRGQVGPGAAPKNNQEAPSTDLSGQLKSQADQPIIACGCQPEVAVVAPMPIEPEIPDEQVRSKGSDPRGECPPGCLDVHPVAPGPGLETPAVDR